MGDKDPDLSHIKSSDYQDVYEPCEDSYLLMDALKDEKPFLKARLPTVPYCLEIGCGSGVIISQLGMLLQQGFFWATDINPKAAAIASQTIKRNLVRGDVVLTDFTTALARLTGKLDVLIFNPPYVPTPPEEMKGDGISRSWAGGERGREVLDLLLPHIKDLLSECGVFYLVVLDANDPKEIDDILAEQGFQSKVIAFRKAFNERLSIVKYTRRSHDEAQEGAASSEVDGVASHGDVSVSSSAESLQVVSSSAEASSSI